jgi:hypothetical protein
LSFWIARSASIRWSNRMKPTPLERPASGVTHIIWKHNTVTKLQKNRDTDR